MRFLALLLLLATVAWTALVCAERDVVEVPGVLDANGVVQLFSSSLSQTRYAYSQPLYSCTASDAQCAAIADFACFTAARAVVYSFQGGGAGGRYTASLHASECANTQVLVFHHGTSSGACYDGESFDLDLSEEGSATIFVGSTSCAEGSLVALEISLVESSNTNARALSGLDYFNTSAFADIVVVDTSRPLFGALHRTSAALGAGAVNFTLDTSLLPRGVQVVSPPPTFTLAGLEQSITLKAIFNASLLENLQGENLNFYYNELVYHGVFVEDPMTEFTVRVPIELQLVDVVINPSIYKYNLQIGSMYSGEDLSPLPVSEVLNPLCSDSLEYRAEVCEDDTLHLNIIQFSNSTKTSGLIPPNQGVGNKLEFFVNLTAVPPSEDLFDAAYTVKTCILLHMSLEPMNVSFVRRIEMEIRLLEICPPGTSSGSGSNELGCVLCEDGYYQDVPGSTQCMPVSAGSEVSANRSSLVTCPIGTYSNAQMQRCTLCALGTYSDDRGSSVCKPCPSATLPTTLFEGSTSIDNCTTDERQNSYKNDTGTPIKCPFGTTCDFPGATVETIRLLPGYYRTGNRSLDIRECKPGFCEPATRQAAGGNSSESNSTQTRRMLEGYVSALDTTYCTIHHHGHLCEICDPDYIHRGPQRLCQRCEAENAASDAGRMTGIFFALIIALISVCTFIIYRFYTYYQPRPFLGHAEQQAAAAQKREDEDYRYLTVAWKRISGILSKIDIGGTPFKITIGYYQVVAGMALGLGEFLPRYFKQFADVFSLLSLDFVKVFDFGCSLPEQSHRSSLLFATLTPIAFLFVLFLVERYVTRRVTHKEALHVGFMNLYLWTLFLIYPSISKTIFQTFSCQQFDDGFASIKIDPQIDCNSELYTSLMAYGIVCVIFYVLGVPALFYYLLHKQRFQLNACPEFEPKVSLAYREKNVTVQSTRMLWHSYLPNRYSYEVFELWRKLFQTSVFVFVSQDSAAQVIFLLVTCAVVVVLLSWLDPYVSQKHNALAQWSQWNIFTIAFVALLNRMEIATDNERIALDMMLLVCLVSVPVLALVIGMDWTWAGKCLSRSQRHVATWFKRTREFNNTSSFKPDAAAVNQRLNDKIVHSAVEELQQSIAQLANKIDENTKDKMLIIVEGLDKKYREESEVSRVERSILLNDASEKGHLKKRVVELIEENDHLKYTKAYLEEQVRLAGDQFEREVAAMETGPGGVPVKRGTNLGAEVRRPSRIHRASIVETAKKVTDMFFFANPSAPKEDTPSFPPQRPLSSSQQQQQKQVVSSAPEPSLMFSRVMAESVSSVDSKGRMAKSTSDRKF